MTNKNILDFYKKTSCYTDLGFYKKFAQNLPNDLNTLCELQRKQILHPTLFYEKKLDKKYWGDLKKIPKTRLIFEDDLFPNAISMLAELLRKDPKYSLNRKVNDKIHTTCRGQSILLTSILKAKGIPARSRSGFDSYEVFIKNLSWDHWLTEYYNSDKKKWQMVDPDYICHKDKIDFDFCDVPANKFTNAADAYLGIRNNKYPKDKFYYSGYKIEEREKNIMQAIIRVLFYDFNSLMNNEIPMTYVPSYVYDSKYILGEKELKELDYLANLMLDSDKNFNELKNIFKNKQKYSILKGGINL